MFTQTIERYQVRQEPKPKFRAGSEEHRYEIYSRTIERVREDDDFDANNMFTIRKSGEEGYLMGLEEDFLKVEWEGMKCKFIELFVPSTNKFALYHPSDLKVVP